MKAAEQFDVWVTTSSSNAPSSSWPAQIMGHYADATGHSPVLPEWASRLWQSKNRYQTQEELLDVVQEHRKRSLPLSVIVADYFTWSPSYSLGDYKFDNTCWPDPKRLMDKLESWNVKLMVSPYSQFINNRSENYAAAKAAGDLFAVTKDGDVVSGFHHSAVYDVYSAKTRKFMGGIIRDTYLKNGLKVVWHDCDEWCNDSGPGSGSGRVYYPSVGNEDAVASAYPGKLAQTWSEAFLANGVTDGIQLGRSAWAGTQRFGHAVWSGDIGSNWESLTMSISAGQSIGLSGIPWWTTDVGGYGGSHGRAMNTSDPSARELMVRWVQFGAFCPLFRIHGYRAPTMSPTCSVCEGYSCDQGHETAAWAYGETAEKAITKMIHARESLRSYINEQMAEVAKTGVPFMRPVWFEFPGDATAMTSDVEDAQFMAGASYLVAPVTKLGDRNKRVYFPSGSRWKHLFTNVEYDGGKWISVPAPLDTPAVFMRLTDSHETVV
jgi:alpha-D-xyloside xylohydrolase